MIDLHYIFLQPVKMKIHFFLTFSISLKQSETSVRYVAASLGSPSSNNCRNMTISFSNRTAFSRLFFVQTLNADHKIITTAVLSMSI